MVYVTVAALYGATQCSATKSSQHMKINQTATTTKKNVIICEKRHFTDFQNL